MSSKTIICGRLGKDPETKTVGEGLTVSNFSVGSSETQKKNGQWEEYTEWYNCVLFGKEKLVSMLTKGVPISCVARKKEEKYEKEGQTRYITKFYIEEILTFQPTKKAVNNIETTVGAEDDPWG